MTKRQATFLDYDGFLEKFKPKKTTDDCYTPANIYEVVLAWVARKYFNAEAQRRGERVFICEREVVRPFWPGKEFDSVEYPAGCMVIDNPPFSILSKIVKFYLANRIDFFLFSPYLTNFSICGGSPLVHHIIAPVSVLYENGATVDTSFVTNLGEFLVETAIDLFDALERANAENVKKTRSTLPKYEYPAAVVTSAMVGYLCKHHTPWRLRASDAAFIRKLDAQGDKTIYGAGFLLSERAAAERAAAERAAAERAAAERAAAKVWQLSPREVAMQKLLGREPLHDPKRH